MLAFVAILALIVGYSLVYAGLRNKSVLELYKAVFSK